MSWFLRKINLIFLTCALCISACSNRRNSESKAFKGLYSFGPDAHVFKNCINSHEYWVTDSCNELELKYSHLVVDRPYTETYVEVEGYVKPSAKSGMGADYDSTIVVKKLNKISKDIPEEMCN